MKASNKVWFSKG